MNHMAQQGVAMSKGWGQGGNGVGGWGRGLWGRNARWGKGMGQGQGKGNFHAPMKCQSAGTRGKAQGVGYGNPA